MRHPIHATDPGVIEEVKWRKPTNPAGVPVWSHAGIVCTGEIHRDLVKLALHKACHSMTQRACPTPAWIGMRRAITIGKAVERYLALNVSNCPYIAGRDTTALCTVVD